MLPLDERVLSSVQEVSQGYCCRHVSLVTYTAGEAYPEATTVTVVVMVVYGGGDASAGANVCYTSVQNVQSVGLVLPGSTPQCIHNGRRPALQIGFRAEAHDRTASTGDDMYRQSSAVASKTNSNSHGSTVLGPRTRRTTSAVFGKSPSWRLR